jgi:hypothetical protein
MVEDHKSGRIFPAGNLEELKRAILQVTEPGALEAYKRQSRLALERWRKSTDPAGEVRRGLTDAAVLKP